MMSKHKKREEGFTLIELIMVIVILGIISAVAIPKFLSLSDTAKISAARGVGGGLSGTISSSHADYLLNNNTYTLASILSATAFAGGITYDTASAVPGSGEIAENGVGNEIELNYKNAVFVWSFTPLNTTTGTPAFIAEKSGEFPK